MVKIKSLSEIYNSEIGFCFDCESDAGDSFEQDLIIAREQCGINSNFVNWSRINFCAFVSGIDLSLVEKMRNYLMNFMGWETMDQEQKGI